MKKFNLTRGLVLLVLTFSYCLSYGQILSGYYDPANGLTGDQLKEALHNIIDGHTTYPYSSSGTDTWDILKEADRDPSNPNNVIGIYSGFSMNGPAEYNGGDGWSREHVWAKSRGDFGTSQGAGTDCHHLRAEDVSTNSARGNRNFDNADYYYTDASGQYNGATLSKTSDSEYVWEPRDVVKGDVARMIFYMVVRYEGDGGEPDLELTETYQSSTSNAPLHAKLSTLIAWHLADPVDNAEINRNEVIYSYQNNRNPFIDHPEYVCQIYTSYCSGGNTAPVITSTGVTSGTVGQTYTYNVTATDNEGDAISLTATTKPSWLSFTDNGNGTGVLTGTPSSSGSGSVVLTASDGSASSQQSFTISVSTSGGGGDATEVFLSEYVEGSSYNKGLEIANFTGSSIDLSNYSIQKATNGSGSWGSELTLSGTLSNGSVYVIVHSSATSSMQAVADLSTGSGPMSFNGNDAIGLFKNGTLIDVIGIYDSSADFAKDVTLVRKATITSPSTTYNANDWNQFGQDTLGDLGTHTFDGGSAPTCDAPSGLSSTNITTSSADISWSANSNASGYNVDYRVSGTSNWTSFSVGSNSTTLSGLSAGTTYEFRVNADCGSSTSSYSSIDNFTTSTPVCDTPTGLAAFNVTTSSADISWNASSGASSYEVGYRVSGTSSWTSNNTSSTSYSFSGLTEGASYEVRVIADCGSVNSDEATTSFVTESAGMSCQSAISAPYNESFESGFGAWTNVSGDDFNWTRKSGSTPSSSTGPNGAYQGSYYIYVESSSPNYSYRTTIIESPCFDLTSESTANFSFKYHMYGASNMGGLELQASTNGSSWATVWSKTGNQGDNWLNDNVDLSTYTGNTVKLRFVGETGSTWQGDMAIDDIALSTDGSSTSDVVLTIVLDNYPEETTWEVKDGSNVVATGGNYFSRPDGSTVTETIALNDGCYDFVMYDSYGDGICCSYGNGSYELTQGSTVLASGGAFGSSETTSICVSGGSSRTMASGQRAASTDFNSEIKGFTMAPNPVRNTLNVYTGKMKNTSYSIFDAAGKVWSEGELSGNRGSVNVSPLKAGFYYFKAMDGEDVVVKKFVKQ